jgi:D-alanyl-D-alanine carboxypeptidase/D-alanyl-D-alanine-endopeptidase (penicillin-binding protein 4)
MPALRPVLFLVLLLSGVSAIAREALPPAVAQALARARVPAEAVSIVVEEAGGPGRALLSHRASVPMNPASVMKLVTTLAGLETLGPSWTWKTPVYIEGTAREGTLYGNVYIQGQGDPKLVAERLWLLLRRVQGLDIRNIAGDIVLDRSAFEVPTVDPGEFDGEPLRPYNAAPDALLLNFKSVLMTFVPDRSANVRDAFLARRQFDGLDVVIVDDVMTTGATLHEAAAALKRAGAVRVRGWILARTLLRE